MLFAAFDIQDFDTVYALWNPTQAKLFKLAISEFPNSKKLCKNIMILGSKRIFSDQNNSGIRTLNS